MDTSEPLSLTEQGKAKELNLRVSTCEMCGRPTLSSKVVVKPRTCGMVECHKKAGEELGNLKY